MHFALADLLVDLVQNAAAAGSTLISITWTDSDGWTQVRVEDNGCGMTPEQRQRALSPFYSDGVKHPDRKVGLGLPFLAQTAESVGGSFELQSAPGRGTTVGLLVPADHLDLPPRGDLVSAFVLALAADSSEVVVTRFRGAFSYELRKSKLVEVLGGLETVEALGLLTQFVKSQEDDVWQR